MRTRESNDAKTVIKEIDNALLGIYHAKERGYQFFRFETKIKALLDIFVENREEKIKERLYTFFSVLNDLNSPAGKNIYTFYSIDKVNEIVYFTVHRKLNDVSSNIY
jgi:hypothetical protein